MVLANSFPCFSRKLNLSFLVFHGNEKYASLIITETGQLLPCLPRKLNIASLFFTEIMVILL